MMDIDKCYPVDIRLIGQTLSDDSCGDNIKLHAVQNLKTFFSSSNTAMDNIALESLLDKAVVFQASSRCDKFLVSYGMSLIDYLGRDASLESKLLLQIELVLFQLNKQDEQLSDTLAKKLWRRMEDTSIFCSEFVKKVIVFSKKFLEEVVLDWVEGTIPTPEIDYLVRMSVDSPQLFQAITAIFYQVVVKSEGNLGILELMRLFVSSVMLVCEKDRKDFLGLYPRDCRRLVSLLMVPPQVYPDSSESDNLVTRNLIGSLLSDMFFKDNRKTLMLLSNFPEWLTVLKLYLDQNYA